MGAGFLCLSESHLQILCDQGLLKSRNETSSIKLPTIPGRKPETIKTTTTYYRITSKGEEFVLAGFKWPDNVSPARVNVSINDSPGAMAMVNSPASQQISYSTNPHLEALVAELQERVNKLDDIKERDAAASWLRFSMQSVNHRLLGARSLEQS